MSKALQCDRCGMYYPIYIKDNEPNSVRLTISSPDGILVKIVKNWDLCKTCRDTFIDFMTISEENSQEKHTQE